MRTDEEINYLIERIEYRLHGEALQKPVNNPIREAYQKAIEILKNRETDAFKAGLNYSNRKNVFLNTIISQATAFLTGDVAPKLVLMSFYLDGTADSLDDLEGPPPEPTRNTMTFSHIIYDFNNPVYAIRYCLEDGNSPFTSCPWDLTAKSVIASDDGIFAVPIDLKKILLPDGRINEKYIDGVSGGRKDIILMLLESDPEFLLESRAFNPLGEDPDSPTFQEDLKNRIDYYEKFTNETGIVLSNNINDEIIKGQTFASREISFSRANIISIVNYSQTNKLLQFAIMNNRRKGRHPFTGLNYIP